MVRWISKTSTVFSGRPLPRQLWSLYSYLTVYHHSFRIFHIYITLTDLQPFDWFTPSQKGIYYHWSLQRFPRTKLHRLLSLGGADEWSTNCERNQRGSVHQHEVGDSSRIVKKNPLSVWHHIWINWAFLMHTIVDSCCCFCFASCCLLVTRIHKIYIG